MKTLLAPVNALFGVFGTDKSFRENMILGSDRLNKLGLHRRRVQLAASLAGSRRARLSRLMSDEDVAAFERDGYFLKTNALPPTEFNALRAELMNTPLSTREMRQGPTITRMAPLTTSVPLARAFASRKDIKRKMGYAGGRAGAPVVFLQTVIAEASQRKSDPQSALHSDTFHSTAKLWLFLEDVGEDDGPFAFVPGSHRLTKERLDWEYEQSLTARHDTRLHHSLGSFRMDEADLSALGYGKPTKFSVKANTLVIADTYGFHRRTPSLRPTSRVELHGYLRTNPFVPWNGGGPTSLPGIAKNQAEIWFRYLDWQDNRGKSGIWKDIGSTTPYQGN